MLVDISVTDDDIAYAERILLLAGDSFDAERRMFIRNMTTLDLQAVPGSGKTTALLAKLLILDRYLPFEDGSGNLVISHTNAAIDEIKGKIGSHCVNLFNYPNFVGTIQSFVDEFVAVPFYTNKYKKTPTRIDDDIYNQKFTRRPFGIKGFTPQETKNSLRFLKVTTKKIRWSFTDGKLLLTDGYCGKEIDFKKPRGSTSTQNYVDWTESEKDRVRRWVSSFKLSIIESGCLCYDDAYFLARMSLIRNAPVKLLLQKRFGHVFVDEMQDMERHQYELLEDLFYDEGASVAKYQRIGDKNQSIFDGRNSAVKKYLVDRSTLLELSGSYRLSPILADVVNAFAIDPIRIEGRRKNPDGSPVSIKPRLIVYSDSTKGLVIARFASIIKDLTDSGAIPTNPSNRYKAIAWATKEESGKVRLPDYFPSYTRVEIQRRADHSGLSSHLNFVPGDDRSLAPVEMAIVNALLRILRLEKAEDLAGKYFVRRTMHEFLKEIDPEYWGVYQSKVYEWSLEVVRGNTAIVLTSIRSHLPTFLSVFGLQIVNSRDFVNDIAIAASDSPSVTQNQVGNTVVYEGIHVEVATVHRVKGETHTATLYMETFYERGGGGNYESERLAVQLMGQTINAEVHDLVRQSAKMVYVGFSRPTHLLCFALHESRFAKIEAGMTNSAWEVLRL